MTQAAILAASGSPGTTTGFKNKFINGNMAIDQRNAGASITGTGGGKYATDRWRWDMDSTPTLAIQQSTTAPTGYGYSLYANFTASTTVSAGASNTVLQKIEGYNTVDLAFGTASAQSISISFWVRGSVTGTYGVGIANAASTWSYPAQYTINSANTWEYKTISLSGATSGTFIGATNGIGLVVLFDMGSGTSSEGTANTWQSGLKTRVSGNVNLCTQSSATWYITGVQLEVGTTATNFDFRSIGTELGLCYRYYYQMNGVTNQDILVGTACDQTTWLRYSFALPTTMRAAPSLVSAGGTSYANLISSGGRASTSISLDNTSATNACVNLYSAGISAGTTGTFRLQAGLYLGLSAEL
jgi:hypothetical protein